MLPRIDTNLIAANQQPIDLTITQLGLRSNLPKRNVRNTDIGYGLYESGLINAVIRP